MPADQMELVPDLRRDVNAILCPYCGHRAGVHSGPGAPGLDSVPGRCGELDDCPGWHPCLEPEACGGCGTTATPFYVLEGYSDWRCGDCVGDWLPRELPGSRRTDPGGHTVLAVCHAPKEDGR